MLWPPLTNDYKAHVLPLAHHPDGARRSIDVDRLAPNAACGNSEESPSLLNSGHEGSRLDIASSFLVGNSARLPSDGVRCQGKLRCVVPYVLLNPGKSHD